MTARQSTAKRRVFSASSVLDAVAADLRQIKAEDKLTYADLGAVLGKSEDQAAKYCDSAADMGLVSFARGKREWNGRFTGSLDRLCDDSRPGKTCDRGTLTALLDLGAKLARALENDDEIDSEEVRQHRSELENVRDAIDAQLAKLGQGPVAVAGGKG